MGAKSELRFSMATPESIGTPEAAAKEMKGKNFKFDFSES